jgi:hypothetical protein
MFKAYPAFSKGGIIEFLMYMELANKEYTISSAFASGNIDQRSAIVAVTSTHQS